MEDDLASWTAESDFDIVYSIGVAHHTVDSAVTLKNLLRRVRPGGYLCVSIFGVAVESDTTSNLVEDLEGRNHLPVSDRVLCLQHTVAILALL